MSHRLLGRRGVGAALVLVLVMVFILGTVGFARLAGALQAGAATSKNLRGDLALLAAESAVDEMSARLEADASRAASPVFAKLRAEVYLGQTGQVGLDAIASAALTQRGLASAEMQGVSIDSCSAEVVFQRQFEDLPYEKFGLIRYRAKASARGGFAETVGREVTVGQEFKTVLATVPRPFDQSALFVVDAGSVTDFAKVNALRSRYLAMVEAIVKELDAAAAKAPPAAAAQYAELRKFIPAMPAIAERVQEIPAGPAAVYSLGADGQHFPIDALDLASRLVETEAKTEPSRRALEVAAELVRHSPGEASAHAAMLSALPAALEGTQAMLDRIWTFGEVFHLLGPTQKPYPAVMAEVARLGYAHWQRVASYVLRADKTGSASAHLGQLRAKLGGAPSGVVLVEAAGQPVVVNGAWGGKLVLVVRDGDVLIDSPSAPAGDESLLTVVCLGGRVEVKGRAEASVVLAGDSAADVRVAALSLAAGAEIAGNLVAVKLPPSKSLAGHVVCKEKFRSGITTAQSAAGASLGHYTVVLAPKQAFRNVERR